MPRFVKQAVVIVGMLFFGTCTVVIQKVIFNMESAGKDGDVHKFEKPWFQTEVMFFGMFGCLAVYEAMHIATYCSRKRNGEETQLLKPGNINSEVPNNVLPLWKQYMLAIAPAMCDLIATASMNIGLLWIPASVWQMLRGSMVVFTAVFSRVFLKKWLCLYRWIGVGIVVVALCIVAISSLMTPCNTPRIPFSSSGHLTSEGVTTAEEVTGILLVVVAQVIQASQIVIEEALMSNVKLPPTLIVGLEGLWGGLACSIVLVIVYWIPPPIGEDTIDSFIMIRNNGALAGTITVYATAILCYNMFGMYVTQVTSSVVRTILEALRTACIWIADLFIHYVVTDNPAFGEVWAEWSYLQLCGFLLLLLGMFVYNGIVQIDGLFYPTKEQQDALNTRLAHHDKNEQAKEISS
ncbi:Integral membrane protein [Pelomyxa schiedti]|nr:Integral membrane protein [Pelomyxa schiedti]